MPDRVKPRRKRKHPRNAVSLFIFQHCKDGVLPEELQYRDSRGFVKAKLKLDWYGRYDTMTVDEMPLYIIKVLDKASFNDLNKTISTLRELQEFADKDAPEWR